MLRPAFRIVATALTLAVLTLTLHGQSPVRYVYDELGRLVAVIDGNGDTAVYAYDAVGNLLSIARHGPTDVSVYEFTPDDGPSGTTVTIYGSGFSATAGQNTVQFNGTTASVSTATTTSLVVTVPVSATTGPIAVTSPNGNATSADDFVVAAPAGPAITSFTPAIAVAGTTLTISGTGFETVRADNRVRVGISPGTISSHTSTSIALPVPGSTGSGPVTVSTPYGEAVAASTLFVPPSPYTPSAVDAAIELTFAQGSAVAVTSANHIGLAIFDGVSGQRVSVKAVPGPNSTIGLYRPNGTLVTQGGTGISTILLEPGYLASTGTYTVSVDPIGSGTGSVTLTPYVVPADVTGTLAPSTSGDAVTPSLGTPGQNARYTFSGTAGQRISLKISSGPLGGVSLRDPGDSAIASGQIGAVTGFIEPQTLASAGTYAVVADPSGANTGSVTLTAYDVPADISGTIAADGQQTDVVLGTPGQNGALTFSGTASQRVCLYVAPLAPTGAVAILNPDASTLASTNSGVAAGFIDTRVLGTTGTYTVTVNPATYNAGTVKLKLYDVPADSTGSVTVGGSSLARSFAVGQNGTVTFAGTSGQQVTVRLTSNTIGSVAVRLKRANGTLLTSTTSSGGSFNLSTQTLPATETYTIEIDPQQWNAGGITVAVTNP